MFYIWIKPHHSSVVLFPFCVTEVFENVKVVEIKLNILLATHDSILDVSEVQLIVSVWSMKSTLYQEQMTS